MVDCYVCDREGLQSRRLGFVRRFQVIDGKRNNGLVKVERRESQWFLQLEPQ